MTSRARRPWVTELDEGELADFLAQHRPFSHLGAAALGDAVWSTTTLLDDHALLTTEAYQQGREEIIRRQGQDVLELSTPVVSLWDGILALPLIGALDSNRTQVVMEALLEKLTGHRWHISATVDGDSR